jgi:hypothetical protein
MGSAAGYGPPRWTDAGHDPLDPPAPPAPANNPRALPAPTRGSPAILPAGSNGVGPRPVDPLIELFSLAASGPLARAGGFPFSLRDSMTWRNSICRLKLYRLLGPFSPS